MPQRRFDILERVRALMAGYSDQDALTHIGDIEDDDRRLRVKTWLAEWRSRVADEYRVSLDTVNSQIAKAISQIRHRQ